MQTINLSDIYSIDFELHKLFAMKQTWKDSQEFSMLKEPRNTSALLYLLDAKAEYEMMNGERIYAKKSDVVYIPQGTNYKTSFVSASEGEPTTLLLEFEMSKGGEFFRASDNVCVVASGDEDYFYDVFSELVNIYSKPVFSVSAFKASVYGLLDYICRKYREKDIHQRELSCIAPAISYLEKNVNVGITVAQLAKMCHISQTYFRKQFKNFTGVSPLVYCNSLIVAKAKRLLKSGRYTVNEVADILGFEDSGYFTKFFKRGTGRLPSSFL